jgi:hypothetical protein
MPSYLYTLYDTLNIANNKVGLGTTSPTYDFHVEGTVAANTITNAYANVEFAYSALSNISRLHTDVLTTQTGQYINVDSKSLSNIANVSTATLTTDTITALGDVIDISGKTLSNVVLVAGSIAIESFNSANGFIDANSNTLSNVDTLWVNNLTTEGGYINVSGKSFSNITDVRAALVTTDTITSTGEVIDVSAKALSNVSTLFVANLDSHLENINVSGKTLSNVSTIAATTVVTDSLMSSSSLIDGNAITLSNVSTLSVGTVTSDADEILFNNKTLSNINDLYVANTVRVGGDLWASNLHVIGEFTTLNTLTSNTEQMVITNIGTGPALIVVQEGIQPIAAFYDKDETNVALMIADGGLVGFGTASPSDRLHMYHADEVVAHLQSSSALQTQVKLTNSDGVTYLGPNASGEVELRSTALQPMRIGTSNADYIVLHDGKVGFGTTAAYPLDIAGIARVQDVFMQTTHGINTIMYGFNYPSLTNTHTFIGGTLTWTNALATNKETFRVCVKFHIASDTAVAYRKFESLITPLNNSTTLPSQIIATEIADAFNTEFGNISHTVARSGDSSVDVKISWTTDTAAYVGSVQFEVFAASSLGTFTFDALSG